MTKVVKSIFGSTDRSAQTAQIRANESTERFIREQGQQARRDVIGLFDTANINRNLGTQAALDIFGQTIPQQFGAFQQGNVGAQETLLAGLPQIQNAILGLPTELSGLQPRSIEFDTDFAQQQLPDFVPSGVQAEPQNPLINPVTGLPFDLGGLLAGRGP